MVKKPRDLRGRPPATLQSARARSARNRTSPPPATRGRPTSPTMVRFSWPVNLSGWACRVRQRRPPGHGRGAGAELQPEAVVDDLGVAHREAEGEPVGADHGEVVQRQPPGLVGGGAPRRRRSQPRSGLGAIRGGVREGCGGAFGGVPGTRRVLQAPRRPPPQVQGGHLDPDAGVVPGQTAKDETRLALGGVGELLHGEARVAVGVGLEVRVANRGEALDEHDWWVGRAPSPRGRRTTGTPGGHAGHARPWRGR